MLTRRRVIEHGAGWAATADARASAHVLRSPALETVDNLAKPLLRLSAMNAITTEMLPELTSAFEQIGRDPSTVAVVVIGAGKAFSRRGRP